MSPKDWNTKIQIVNRLDGDTKMFSSNSMGIYFECPSENILIVHFKPLNEVFNAEVFTENEGVLIVFERDLIDEDDIEYALDVFALFNKFPKFHITESVQVDPIKQFVGFLKTELYRQDSSYVMLKSLLKVMLLHLIRFQNDGFLKQDLSQKRVFQFLELMEASFLQETNTDYYASQIGISSKRLNQIVKEKLSLTAKQIIQQRQITEAKRMLIKGEITTKELAFQLGFDSLSSFSRFFKKNAGVSASVFKSQH